MHDLINQLESLGLAKAEALVYTNILQSPPSNGSQIAKRVDIPKPSVYLALEKLYKRGLINLIPGKTKQYLAQEPTIALEQLRSEFNQNLDSALKSINQLQKPDQGYEFIHITGYTNFIAKLQQILAMTSKELYIQTNMDLAHFSTAFNQLANKKVRIIIYSFGNKHDYDFAHEMHYDEAKPVGMGQRLLLVSDYRECLMGNGNPDLNYLAISTRQQLQVSLISENIHNAIYWLKLYHEKPGFSYPCRLETLAETDIHLSGYSI